MRYSEHTMTGNTNERSAATRADKRRACALETERRARVLLGRLFACGPMMAGELACDMGLISQDVVTAIRLLARDKRIHSYTRHPSKDAPPLSRNVRCWAYGANGDEARAAGAVYRRADDKPARQYEGAAPRARKLHEAARDPLVAALFGAAGVAGPAMQTGALATRYSV